MRIECKQLIPHEPLRSTPPDQVQIHDELIAGRAARGDRAAFGVLVGRYSSAVHHLVQRMVPEAEDTDRIVIEIFLAVWQELRDPGCRGDFLRSLGRALTAELQRYRSD
ncbi:RNA polymerase sigma-70 factor (ECF subfamily) [Amycolatopsis sulphurea]|uniref:RNA polymerase sigma-70 factor (ECF subfamily) n=1 Tax=Amycolatopsis sulphurea TaxID=76022 RepID=A0A2A9FID7_9PSEU|nr:hypothetical protein [Amycolatopsis sulphurea]PFG50270.1 RNA polymerase sigma-70 factor (ECF subfamily) [Amycolatopsis sulphurea]